MFFIYTNKFPFESYLFQNAKIIFDCVNDSKNSVVKTLRTEHLWTFTVPWHVGDAGQEGIWGLVDKRSRCLTGENFDQTKVSHRSYSAVVSKGSPKSGIREFFLVESGILCFGIRNTDQKSGSHYRLESRTWSKFHWQRIRYPLPIPEIRNHGRGIQNPRLSWISLHGANCHWLRLWPPLKMCKQLHHVTGGHQLHWGTRMNWSILRTCTQPNN